MNCMLGRPFDVNNKKGNTKIMNYCQVIPTFVTLKLMKEKKEKGFYFSYVNVMVHMNFDQFFMKLCNISC
jgi:hypothetical protein